MSPEAARSPCRLGPFQGHIRHTSVKGFAVASIPGTFTPSPSTFTLSGTSEVKPGGMHCHAGNRYIQSPFKLGPFKVPGSRSGPEILA